MKTPVKSISYVARSATFSISIFIVMLMFSFIGYQIMKMNLLRNAQSFGDNLSRTYSLEQQSNFEFYSVLLSFGVTIVDNSEPQEIEEKMSSLSSSFISDIEDIVKEYEEEIANLQEEVEGEMDSIKDDVGEDEAEEEEDYQELDGLYDSLDDILSSIKIIKDSLEDIRNYS